MKLERFFSGLIAALLAFCLSYFGIACLESAFFNIWADMNWLLGFCALWSVFATLCFSIPRGGIVFLCITALVGGFAFREGTLLEEIEALIFQISTIYNAGYGWSILSWGGTALSNATGGLAVLAVFSSSAAAWTLCRRDYSATALLPGALPLAACFIVTDTVPESQWLFGLIAVFLVILLTQSVRVRSRKDGIRLTAILLIPILLASALLFWAVPEEEYEYQISNLRQSTLDWFNNLPFLPTHSGGYALIPGESTLTARLELSSMGPRPSQRYAVMDVVCLQSEMLYLRGQALDTYTGTGWSASEYASGEDIYWPTNNMILGGQVSVELRTDSSYLFFPYYVSGGFSGTDFTLGSIPNSHGLRQYSFNRMLSRSPTGAVCAANTQNDMYRQCLTLPADTLLWCQTLLESLEISSSTETDEIVSRIAQYVEAAAEYDTDTPAMPREETDFVRWFLTESDTGYCTHYASAATVLLRAAGVPARLVTGYAVQTQAGSKVTVTADRAHAWVEYIDPRQGWTVLDPTPGTATEPPTEPTDPSETTAPTETSEPPTDPSETTVPTETTAPTEATGPTAPSQSTAPSQASASGETAASTPDTEEPPEDTPREANPLLAGCLMAVAGIALLAVVLAGQYTLRRRLRHRRLTSGEPNRQALAKWRYISLLCRRMKLRPPPALWTLAEKAMFSQHTITHEELRAFDEWIRNAHRSLREKPWYHQLLLRLFFGLG